MENISTVVKNSLCTGCGTCVGVCPSNAISMRIDDGRGLFLPKIDEKKCSCCNICVKCCPGYSINMEKLNLKIFGKQPKDSLLGNYLNSYIGHSNDFRLQSEASSGGMVTQLLIFALEKGVIDGALVSRMKKDNPLQPEPFIARTREEIISASKSKYCPVPMNVVLRELAVENGKFAVVGLPCHMHGLRMAEARISSLQGKIALRIGLLCSHTVNFRGTAFLLNKFRVNATNVSLIQYRGHGWPGSMLIQLKNGHALKKQFVRGWNAYWNVFSSFFFTPIRCIMCPDQSCEFSDISMGDAWLPEVIHNGIGESVIITRSKESERLLHLLESCNAITLKNISPSKVHESQAFSLDFKKNKIGGRLSLLKIFGMNIPTITPAPRSKSSNCIHALLPYLSICMSSNKHFENIMRHIPLPIFRLYLGLFICSSLM